MRVPNEVLRLMNLAEHYRSIDKALYIDILEVCSMATRYRELIAMGGSFHDASSQSIYIKQDCTLRTWKVQIGEITYKKAPNINMAIEYAIQGVK